MKNDRANEIMDRMTAFENDKYTREELLNEIFKLQSEMATITFGGCQAEEKRFYDISDYYTTINSSRNVVSDEMIERFRKECGEATNCLRGLISGLKGENKTFYRLGDLVSVNRIRKNIEIRNGNKRTEIDALVVTEKAAFIIEVKNTKRDAFIDENGQYYRTGEYLRWDSDLGSKLALREAYVRRTAKKSGIDNIQIVKIVVFTDNRIRVQNKCKDITTCFLNQLTSVIDTYQGENTMTLSVIDDYMKLIDSMNTVTRYEPGFDVQSLKRDFAEIASAMNYQEEPKAENRTVWWKTAFSVFSKGGIAAAALGGIAAILLFKH